MDLLLNLLKISNSLLRTNKEVMFLINVLPSLVTTHQLRLTNRVVGVTRTSLLRTSLLRTSRVVGVTRTSLLRTSRVVMFRINVLSQETSNGDSILPSKVRHNQVLMSLTSVLVTIPQVLRTSRVDGTSPRTSRVVGVTRTSNLLRISRVDGTSPRTSRVDGINLRTNRVDGTNLRTRITKAATTGATIRRMVTKLIVRSTLVTTMVDLAVSGNSRLLNSTKEEMLMIFAASSSILNTRWVTSRRTHPSPHVLWPT